MDFNFTEEQQAVRELSRRILGDLVTPASLREIEENGEWFHRPAWRQLAESGLLGVALPEDAGGGDLGVVALCLLLEQVGRAVAPVPALATLAMGALPLHEHGSSEQRALLRGVAEGRVVLTAAVSADATARPVADGWQLDGVMRWVPAAPFAHWILVPAQTGKDTVGVFLLDPATPGVQVQAQTATNGEQLGRVALSGVRVSGSDALGDPRAGNEILHRTRQLALLGLCALALGVAQRALEMTAKYSGERHQFGQPIGSFQAVSQRAADAYIDLSAMKVTLWQAAWRLEQGLRAHRELAIAKFWAAEGGHRILAAAQHIHGGMGFDRDYPLHRYFVWSKRIEMTLGGASAQLEVLRSIGRVGSDGR